MVYNLIFKNKTTARSLPVKPKNCELKNWECEMKDELGEKPIMYCTDSS
jgi:hypothetical protein